MDIVTPSLLNSCDKTERSTKRYTQSTDLWLGKTADNILAPGLPFSRLLKEPEE